MSLDNSQIEHLAHLARIELSAEEKQKFSGQLSDVLAYFEKLKKIDTTSVPETSQVTNLKNIQRGDEVKICDEEIQNLILGNAPDKSGRMIKVKKIL